MDRHAVLKRAGWEEGISRSIRTSASPVSTLQECVQGLQYSGRAPAVCTFAPVMMTTVSDSSH